MKKINKIMSFALALTLTAGVAAGTVVTNADYDEPAIAAVDAAEADENGFIIEDGVLTGYTGTDSEVTIPGAVKTIANSVFAENTTIVKVIIPDSVTTIVDGSPSTNDGVASSSKGAFRKCTSLVTVEGGKNLQFIGSGTFLGCTALKNIEFGSKLINIGEGAFRNCTNLAEVTLPDSVVNLGANVFNGCSKLEAVTIGSGITTINDGTFAGTKLTSIIIPETVDTIGNSVFSGCSVLTNVQLPSKIESIGDELFNSCSSLTEITIPEQVTTIGKKAFNACKLLKNVTVPDNVTSIGEQAFGYCTSLDTVILGRAVTTIQKYAFLASTAIRSLTLPTSVATLGSHAFGYNNSLSNPIMITDITYEGTKAQWEDFIEANNGTTHCLNPDAAVFCTDATINDYVTEFTLTPPTKTNYVLNEELDLTGAKVTAKYAGMTPEETVDVTADMCTGFDSKKVGTKTVTVTYKDKTATFDVTVSEKPVIAVDTVTVSTVPTKTEYTVGDTFDVTGGKLTVTYTGGKEAETIDLTAEMCTGFDSTTAGTKTITVTYEGKTATFEVTVKEKPVIDEGTVIEVGADKDCKTIGEAVAKINADAKAKKLGTLYTIKFSGDMNEAKALSLPDTTVWLKAATESFITVPSITAKGSLKLENVTVNGKKGAAAITVKKAFTAENSKFGKTTVTGHADISDCEIYGALTLNEKTGETKLTNVTVEGKAAVANTATLDSCKMGALSAKGVLTVNGGEYESITVSAKAGATTLNGEIKIAKNLTVSNDLVIDGNSEVGGKFTAKAALSINGFTVKNGK